ncbi:hypothetical protein [Novosphingobium sp. FKTRR1]|uniref:hypothetical protein n=1 Tax=Novosphingobium sp. FKTRR1 TaxID=2879118 RepID=UPI001CF0C884|nr:hypothetical protein [Novosphingobium sp. FKTRR1]
MNQSKLVLLVAATMPMILGGCATTGSVKRAQASADQAMTRANEGFDAAGKAQSSADAAGSAAQRAQASADAAAAAAQGAGASAQGALATAQAAQAGTARIGGLETRLRRLEHWKWAQTHKKKAHKHRHHHAAKSATQAKGT